LWRQLLLQEFDLLLLLFFGRLPNPPAERTRADDAVKSLYPLHHIDHAAPQEAHHFVHHYHFIRNIIIIPDLLM
jgi:hypothetical protein